MMGKWLAKMHSKIDYIRKVWSILPASRKAGAIRLWILMTIGMVLEMVGIGLIIPLIALLTQQDIAASYPLFQDLLDAVGNPETPTSVALTMLALVGVYVLKNLFLAFLAWQQSRFIFGLQSELSQKLFSIYLRQPYTFHLQRNSAHLIRNMQGEMSMFMNAAVSPSILISAEILVALGLFGLLFFVEPVGSIVVFTVLIMAGAVFQRYTKHRITNWGRQRQFHEGQRIKQLHQGLGGAKDVKLLGREDDFLKQYAEHTKQTMRMNQRQMFFQQIPRLWLEILAIVGLTLLMSSMLYQGKSLASVLPVLGLFAAVTFRLMPSANRIVSAMQQLRYGLPVVDLVHRELNLDTGQITTQAIDLIKLEKELELVNVSYAYPNTKSSALSNISLRINKGEMVGFIGESGSGKSTLVDIVLGLLAPSDGCVLVDGKNIQNNLRSWQDQIGYVPQSIYLTDDTLRRNVAFGLAEEEIDDVAVERALKAAQLENFVATLPEGINTVVGERGVRLSGGQRQRIGIARALYHDPQVLVLDEATSALDTGTEDEVMNAVFSLKGEKTLLIVAHRLSTVQRCNRIVRLNAGRIEQQGTPLTMLRSENSDY